ncbi:MAG TPA: MEDS domain-containing protein [Actinocrinis sp.]|nr:MEDS domain-containing protein [Actinocrinis sp.]
MVTGSMALEGTEVMAAESDVPWAFRSGEHVCWLVRSSAEYDVGERDLLARAAFAGESVMIVGDRVRTRHNAPGASGDVDVWVGRDGLAVLEVMREQAHTVDLAGRGLRILAQMEHLAPPDARLEDLIACEIDVAEVAGLGATSVVCAYRRSAWKRELLSGVSAVHSRLVGMGQDAAGFRIARVGADAWALHGVIGFEAAGSFAAALRALLSRSAHLRLHCAGLELIDAAGWYALVAAATGIPGTAVLLEQVNDTVATAWRLSGYEGTTPVQVRT